MYHRCKGIGALPHSRRQPGRNRTPNPRRCHCRHGPNALPSPTYSPYPPPPRFRPLWSVHAGLTRARNRYIRGTRRVVTPHGTDPMVTVPPAATTTCSSIGTAAGGTVNQPQVAVCTAQRGGGYRHSGGEERYTSPKPSLGSGDFRRECLGHDSAFPPSKARRVDQTRINRLPDSPHDGSLLATGSRAVV